MANAGGDTINTVKQAAEFGITQGGQSLAALLLFITDVRSLGLEVAQGLVMTEAFYWDLNDQTREFSARFAELHGGAMPTMVQAGVYASVLHYLKAIEATGTVDADPVMEWMKANPTQDPLFGGGEIREDGRHVHDMYLFRVKAPDQSEGEWDLYELLATIPADQAFRPLDEGNCPLVTN
jgi:branched-chain amino acid transport system substrate-binding protein